jgi:hypothetical protein
MSTEPALGFPTFTGYVSSANPGVAPGASDMNRFVNNEQSLTARPTVVATRMDTSLVHDSSFHPCRFDRVRWDWVPDGNHFCPDIATGAAYTSTFVMPWSGFYKIDATERISGAGGDAGYVQLQVWLDNGIAIDGDLKRLDPGVQQILRISCTWRFDAGSSITFQHRAATGADVALLTDNPVPFAAITWLGRNYI